MDIKLIDLHCDTILRCTDEGLDLTTPQLHWSIGKRPQNLRIGQAMAIFVHSDLKGAQAQQYFLKAHEVYKRQAEAHRFTTLTDLRQIPAQLNEKPLALFLTVEGGSVLGGDILWVDKLHEMGVKMLTLTWNGENELCGGVGSSKAFTPFGRQAVARMEELGMAIDVSHLNDESFWQLCEFARKPFCASHSNSRAVCSHPRNLTDGQFREIAARGGVVGLNYFVKFVAGGGQTKTIDDLLRHAHHFLELGGEDTIALGSDFDGADMPGYLDGIDKLPALIDALERSGIGKPVVEKIIFGNAARYLANLS